MWDSITQDELNPVVTAVATLQIAVAALAVGASEWLRRRAGARLAFASAGAPEGEPPAALVGAASPPAPRGSTRLRCGWWA